MIDKVGGRARGPGSGRWTAILLTVLMKGGCGVLLGLVLLQAWNQIIELRKVEAVVGDWKATTAFAVFFPHYNGNDLKEFQTGGNETKIAEARDLYPILDAKGAVFVDARRYEPGRPPYPWLPVPPMLVNINYLDHYPILDVAGVPIKVRPDEQAWVVAVPAQYRSQEARLREFFEQERIGGGGVDGAVQGQERMLREPVPDRFRRQAVRIIWTKPGQRVFTFNSTVNPYDGNRVLDPIVEIMTPANSLTIDRLNSITGSINTPLKVLLDRDSVTTRRELAPTLRALKLDDNLRDLVVANEAVLSELSRIRSGIAWIAAVGTGALVVMLLLSASVVTSLSDRLRRTLTVRRLHGVGFLRTYREILALLGAVGLGQVAVATGLLLLHNAVQDALPLGNVDPQAEIPRLIAILCLSLVVEVLFAAVVATVVERRSAVKRLKEL